MSSDNKCKSCGKEFKKYPRGSLVNASYNGKDFIIDSLVYCPKCNPAFDEVNDKFIKYLDEEDE